MVSDTDEPGDFPVTHLRVLHLDGFDRDPILYSNHLSSPLGQCGKPDCIQEKTYPYKGLERWAIFRRKTGQF